MSEVFTVDTQEQLNWCWAAVAQSVHRYRTEKQIAQCEVANRLLNRTDCCGKSAPCDSPQLLHQALTQAGTRAQAFKGRLRFEDVCTELNEGRPVCVRIVWFDGGAHFVVIYGYRVTASGERQLFIGDPFYPDSIVEYEEFISAYQN